MQVALQHRTITLDGRPTLVLAGEIHYFRTPPAGWARRLDLLVEAGANTVATYIPWVLHEQPDGSFDLDGRTRPELDLGGFLDLCAARGLWVLARPGPFTMGELRHEGIPGRLTVDHPEIAPVGWDGAAATTSTVDYLAPAFLTKTAGWYAALGPVLAPRTASRGGPVIAVQLDNEIGMLAWVSNTPDLTDHLVADLGGWLHRTHGDALADRYPGFDAVADLAAAVRSPTPAWSAPLRIDLARFMRTRFARYVAVLRELARANGFGAEPLLVNVHGTGGGNAATFPIGIAQLYSSYRDVPGMTSGSDHYIGTPTWTTLAELHMVHAFMAAVHGPDQPLTSLEFEAGTGDYGGDGGELTDPSAVVLKTRLALAQETRLLNWYLFAGGENHLDPAPDDRGTHRFGITGQRHGHAAPVTPEGEPGLSYPSTAASMRLAAVHARWAADWRQQTDDLALGFVADHYATEYRYPGNPVMDAHAAALSWARGGGPGSLLPRLLLGAGFRYGAVDLQSALVDPPRVIALGSPTVLAADVQRRLVDHVTAGGGLLLFGAVPVVDDEGAPCTVLADALGVTVRDPEPAPVFASVTGDGWATGMPELRVGRVQLLQLQRGEVLLREVMSGAPCAAVVPLGAGRVGVVATDVAANPAFVRNLVAELGATPGLRHDGDVPGLLATTSATPDGDRFLHLVNVSPFPQTVRLTLDGVALFDGTAQDLPGSSGRILPLSVNVAGHEITATAEIVAVTDETVTLRCEQDEDRVVVDGTTTVHRRRGTTVTVPLG